MSDKLYALRYHFELVNSLRALCMSHSLSETNLFANILTVQLAHQIRNWKFRYAKRMNNFYALCCYIIKRAIFFKINKPYNKQRVESLRQYRFWKITYKNILQSKICVIKSITWLVRLNNAKVRNNNYCLGTGPPFRTHSFHTEFHKFVSDRLH